MGTHTKKKPPWKYWPGTLPTGRFPSSLTEWVKKLKKVTFWQVQKSLGTSEMLRREELTRIYRCWRWSLILSPCLGFSGLKRRFLMKNSSKADLKELIWSIASLVFVQITGQVCWHWIYFKSTSPNLDIFGKNKGALRDKNYAAGNTCGY